MTPNKLSDFRDPFALPPALALLRKNEWGMGNGQCRECEGVNPGWAYGMSNHGQVEPHETGHTRTCGVAAAIEDLGQSAFRKRARRERRRKA